MCIIYYRWRYQIISTKVYVFQQKNLGMRVHIWFSIRCLDQTEKNHARLFRWCLKLLSVNSFFKPSRIDQWFIKYSKCWKIKTPIYPCLWQIYCARPLLWIFISIKIKVTWFKPIQPSGTKSRPNTMQLRKLFATDSISSILGHLVSLIMRYNRISKIVIIFLKLMSQVFRADLLLDEMQSRMIKLLFHDGTTKGN